MAKGAGGGEGQGPLYSLLSSESISAPSARGTGLTPKKVIHSKGNRRYCQTDWFGFVWFFFCLPENHLSATGICSV